MGDASRGMECWNDMLTAARSNDMYFSTADATFPMVTTLSAIVLRRNYFPYLITFTTPITFCTKLSLYKICTSADAKGNPLAFWIG